MESLNIFIRSIFIDNMVFAFFFGMCSYIAVSKSVKTALGLGAAVTFVMVMTVPLNYLLNEYVLSPGALGWVDPKYGVGGSQMIDLSFLSFIVLNFGGTILLLFTRDTNVINICIGMMRVVSPAYITYICIEILSGTCRGCGDSFFPMLLTCFGVCVLRILWITIAVPLRHEVATVAFSYPLTWTITSILFILYYKRGKWMQKDTLRNAPQGQGKDA